LPHLLAFPLKPHPIGRIALGDGRHWLVLAFVLNIQRFALDRIFASKMDWLAVTCASLPSGPGLYPKTDGFEYGPC
jgi:hypothetical protein